MRSNLIMFIYAIPAILISLSFHEMAHAFASYRLGDPTAKRLGRLSMNPLKHLDPVGTLMLLVSMYSGFGFGWAKPVPIDPAYYRNYKKGTVMVSFAGPLSNLLLAFIFSFPMALIAAERGLPRDVIYDSRYFLFGADLTFKTVLFNISRFFYMINIGLAIFNILPIPPLDGSKILTAVLPAKTYFGIMRYERYIGLVFLALMVLRPGILSSIMLPFRNAVEWLFGMVGSLLI
jgi:Zn-dependent protease